jgi:hypothetical protein
MLASDPIPLSGAEAIGGLFEDSEVIFIQPELHSKPLEFCRPVKEWRAIDLKPYQYMTHNPSVENPTGRNESNLNGQRKYLLHEVDDKSITFEQQLGLIKQLESIVPLKMVVSSGGKSLHAWFHWKPGRRDDFLTLSQKLGGDVRFANGSQLCRLPWGTRRKQGEPLAAEQPIIYWKD